MVSVARVARYFKAYVRVMPKRMKIVSKFMKEKRKLDRRILAGETSNDILSEWKYIVGENKLFRSAEKRENQSLRHYIYKAIKGLDGFSKLEKRMVALQNTQAETIIKSDQRVLGAYGFLLKLEPEIKRYEKALIRLDTSLIRQLENIDNPKQFVRYYKIQERIKISLGDVPQKIAVLQRNLNGLIQRFANIFDRETRNLILSLLVAMIIGQITMMVVSQLGGIETLEQGQRFFTSLIVVSGWIANLLLYPVVGVYIPAKMISAMIGTIRKSI